MRAIMNHRDERERKLMGHPLFAWLRSGEVPLGNRMDILPVSAPLPTMFRDLNMWVLRYPAPASPLEAAINAHTIEDATHSQLYVDDWRALGFDERLGFSAADTLWWLFASPHTRPFRDRLPVLARIAAADRGDPVLRFVQAEAIEASGKAFFAGVTPVAEEFSKVTGVQYRYFGQYHLDRESGHVETGNAFEGIVLDAGQRREAVRLFDRVFGATVAFVDACHEYALAYAGPGVLPRAGRDPGWGTEWETLPWSASQTMEFCYLNPGMDPARYQLLARLAGGQLPWPAPQPRPDTDPVVSRMTSFLTTM